MDFSSIIRTRRPTLGPELSTWMFRIGYYKNFLENLGDMNISEGTLMGRKLGQLLDMKSFDDLKKIFKMMKIGHVDIEEDPNNPKKILLDVKECMICHGVPPVSKPSCGVIAGIAAPMIENAKKMSVTIKETKCSAMGDDFCRFEIEVAVPSSSIQHE
jgi:predicted hydrocarbon binding protein